MNVLKTTILTATILTIAANAAQANTITSDSQAWDNDTTVEIGANYTEINKPTYKHETRTREVFVEASDDCHPAYSYHEDYQVAVPVIQSSGVTKIDGKIVTKIGQDVLVGAGADGSRLYATTAVRNGSLTGQLSVNTNGQISSTASYSIAKNIAVLYHNQPHVSAIGTQVQIGGMSVQLAYNLNGGGYRFGIGQEIGLSKAPTFNLRSVEPVKIVTPTNIVVITPKVIPLPIVTKPTTIKPQAPVGTMYIRGRG